MKHNSEVIKKRADALEKGGAYRTIDKQKYEKGGGSSHSSHGSFTK